MKSSNAGLVLGLCAISAHCAAFTNLNFESAVLPSPGATYTPISSAMPGWQAFLGPTVQTNVLYDRLFLGTAFIGLGRTNEGFPVLQDSFSALLAPGASPFNGSSVGVTLAQHGQIPDDAQSLRFFGRISYIGPSRPLNDFFGLYFNGQRLSVTDAVSESGSYNYAADISPFAGQDGTLSFTSFNLFGSPNGLILDSISFSPAPVPEPSSFALFGLSAVLGWLYWRRKAR